jgi:hypothetical protein
MRGYFLYSFHSGLKGLRVFIGCQFEQRNTRYILQKKSLKTLNLLVSNGIIFVLYNLYFINQLTT